MKQKNQNSKKLTPLCSFVLQGNLKTIKRDNGDTKYALRLTTRPIKVDSFNVTSFSKNNPRAIADALKQYEHPLRTIINLQDGKLKVIDIKNVNYFNVSSNRGLTMDFYSKNINSYGSSATSAVDIDSIPTSQMDIKMFITTSNFTTNSIPVIKGFRNADTNNIRSLIVKPWAPLDLSFRNIRDSNIYYHEGNTINIRGSILNNVRLVGNNCPDTTGAIRINVYGAGVDESCNKNGLITFISNRRGFIYGREDIEITPLGANETFRLDKFIETDNSNHEVGGTSYIRDMDLFNIFELGADEYGIQPNRDTRVSRFIFSNSTGRITITGGQLLTAPEGVTSNDIKLYGNLLKIIPSINTFYNAKKGFQFRVDFKQAATPQFNESTASIVLQYDYLI